MTPRQKLAALRRELHAAFIERDEIVDGSLVGLLAGEHVLLIGPVGTAKSMLARTVCEQIEGATYFGWLLTKFSTPEEIFGPISLRGLEADRFERIVDGKLATAHIAFLDEVFKANSAILNSLLAILNERIYHNGTRAQPAPLLTLFGASNELPEESELLALYDRFLLRFQIDYIVEDRRFLALLSLPQAPEIQTRLTLDELRSLQSDVASVTVPTALLLDLVALRRTLTDRGIEASDRRYRKCLAVLRSYALLEGRDRVVARDLVQLEHVLWNDPTEQAEVADQIMEIIRRFSLASAELMAKAQEQEGYAARYWPSDEATKAAQVESLAKLRHLLADTDALLADCHGRDDGSEEALASTRETISTIVDDLLRSVGESHYQ